MAVVTPTLKLLMHALISSAGKGGKQLAKSTVTGMTDALAAKRKALKLAINDRAAMRTLAREQEVADLYKRLGRLNADQRRLSPHLARLYRGTGKESQLGVLYDLSHRTKLQAEAVKNEIVGKLKGLYSPIGAPVVKLRDKLLGFKDWVADDPDALAATVTTGLGIPTALLLASKGKQSTGSSPADTKDSSDSSSTSEDKHSRLAYGATGAALSAALAAVLSSKKNRLRNILIAGSIGGASGAGLAHYLNSKQS